MPEISGLSISTIYRKIDMFYERCVSFMHEREDRLRSKDIERLYLSSDRQEYHANWTDEQDKRHIVVSAIGTADRKSGYVFGMESNFDPSIDLAFLHSDEIMSEDRLLDPYLRSTARLWTEADYQRAVDAQKQSKTQIDRAVASVSGLSAAHMDVIQAEENEDWENSTGSPPEAFTNESYLPTNGALVHLEYTMYAHYLKLQKLVGHARNLYFYLDRESGINRALALAFRERMQHKDFAAMFVAFSKNLTVNERRILVQRSYEIVRSLIRDGVASSTHEAHKIISEESMETPSITYKNRDYFSVPIHRMNEVERLVSFITPIDGLSLKSKGFLARMATLAPIDTFFNQVRRRTQSLERPIHSQSNKARVWLGYSPYSPAQIDKELQILRCYRNFVLKGKDGKTPAQRLGIAKGPVEIRKILYP